MSWAQDVATSLVTRPRRWAAWAAVALVVAAVLLLGVVAWIGSERAIHPAPLIEAPSAAEFTLPLEPVAFLSRDGTRLAGWFTGAEGAAPGGRRAASTVVLLHGYGDRKECMLPHADYLRAAGHNVLLFDFRASGASAGTEVTIGWLEQEDALGALDYLEARGDIDMTRVGLQGVSMGGAVAIMAGARDDRVAGVVAEAPFKDVPSEVAASFEHRIGLPSFPFAPVTVWLTERRLGVEASEISPLARVGGLAGRPLLVIDDEADESIAPGSALAVFEAASEPKHYWLATGAAHAEGLRTSGAAYMREVTAFWADALGASGVTPANITVYAGRCR